MGYVIPAQAMTEDIRYDYTRGDCWCSDAQEVEIREGSVVRLRIMGITVEAGAVVSFMCMPLNCSIPPLPSHIMIFMRLLHAGGCGNY